MQPLAGAVVFEDGGSGGIDDGSPSVVGFPVRAEGVVSRRFT